MSYGDKKSTFDELVAGISADERQQLLKNLNHNNEQEIRLLHSAMNEEGGLLDTKYNNEPMLYKLILWIRSVLTKQNKKAIYNDDLINILKNKINRNHPGTLDVHNDLLQSLFYEKLKEIKSCADFFKPYISTANENPGKFYVFLSTFVAPGISEKIAADADPYTIPFDKEATNELKSSLLKRMENDLKTIDRTSKEKLYSAVRSLTWLKQFSELPFIHFTSQFTAIVSSNYTCPFMNAQIDYPAFARVLQDTTPIPKEALESLFLFTQRESLKHNSTNEDVQKVLKDFMTKAISSFSSIQMFVATIPISSLGKVIFSDYEWQPANSGGGEDWFMKFKDEWKNLFGSRWVSWLRDKKKKQLSKILEEKFNLKSFPELREKPWKNLWGGLQFKCEMTAGLLGWFTETKAESVMDCLNTVILEGIFIKKENRTSLAESINDMVDIIQQVTIFLDSIEIDGSVGSVFKKYETEHTHTIKAQQLVTSMLINAETKIRTCGKIFCDAAKEIEKIFHGILDETRTDKEYASLQNLMTIRNSENKAFRKSMAETLETLTVMHEVLVEIEPLDLPSDQK